MAAGFTALNPEIGAKEAIASLAASSPDNVHPAAPRSRPPSRPTTPLRRSSRSSLHPPCSPNHPSHTSPSFPLDSLEPAFAELSDSLTDLDTNLQHLQLMNESIGRWSESFSAFLYGLNVNAFCVDFPEAPIQESFQRAERHEAAAQAAQLAAQMQAQVHGQAQGQQTQNRGYEAEMTFL
ncbi:DASH complex subunit Dam1-domain-containing protein [Kalaharituber pfeilii]|nr:DASH complex subunit Dam1-domain-containing protein [Kalaharituber pfeilii]